MRPRWAEGRLRAQSGFSLIEVLIATMILIVGLLALLSMLDTSVKAGMTTSAREGATNVARQIIEDARTVPYAQIMPTTIESQLQAVKAESEYPLADASASEAGWQIKRRGFTYTVDVEECAIDDPKDGLAKTHELVSAGGTFCEGQESWKEGMAVDTEPEDLKRITAKVSWTIDKHTLTETQVSTLTAAGQAVGLTAKELKLVEPPVSYNATPTAPVITEQYTKMLEFSVSFPEDTSAIDWSLEGAKQQEIPVSSTATSTTFKWTIADPDKGIDVSDGTYEVSAQAVDSTGVIGPAISIPVRLIRTTPVAPGEAVGGFDTILDNGVKTEVAELQWKADSERDVIGYRVNREHKELVCPASAEALSTATSCTDFKPLEGIYTVAPLYRNAAEELKEGAAASVKVTRSESVAPSAPASVTLTKNANGSVTLTWPASSGASFYRIYRGSENYTSRYGETSETSFTDTDASASHEYWVTAVGAHLTESAFVGPVSG